MFLDYTLKKRMMLSRKKIPAFSKLWKTGFDTLQNVFDVSLKNEARFLSYIHKAFWINLVIHMCNKRRVLGITLLQTPKIMPIFLCVQRDKLCKNDPCLSRAGVRLERKRSEDAGQMISDCFCVSKCHLHRLAQIMAQSKKRGHSAQIMAQHKKRGHSNS